MFETFVVDNIFWIILGMLFVILFAVVGLVVTCSMLRKANATTAEQKTDVDEMTQMINDTLPVFMEKKREADEATQIINDTLPTFIEIWDDNLNLIGCNQRTLDVFGLSSKEEYLDRYHEFAPQLQPSGRPSYKNAVGCVEVALREGSAQFGWVHQKSDGEQLPVDVTCVRTERDGRQIVVAYNHDLRPAKEAIKREREAEKRVRFMLDAAPMPCCFLDENHLAMDCNKAAIDLFVKKPDKPVAEIYPDQKDFDKCVESNCKNCDYRGHDACFPRKYLVRNYHSIFPTYYKSNEHTKRLIAECCKKALKKEVYQFEFPAVTLYGDTIPCNIIIVPIKYHKGYGFAMYMQDLREERRRKAAEDKTLAKTRFLEHMSHEIRTPMNAVIGMAELAMRADRIEDAREHILTVRQAGANLLSMINDILDISKVEKGKLDILPADYHFLSMLSDVINIIQVKAAEANLSFVVKVDGGIPNSLRGAAVRIRQVLLNLLGNAVKYTRESGFVSLSIRAKPGDDETVKLTIDVEDSGLGIEKENIETLFDEYSRFDREKNKGAEGTGLGLAITWHIVKAMDGEISVSSEYGKGSTFTVTLPQKVRSQMPFCLVENAGEKSVLVYEKRDIYASSLVFAMENLGVNFTQVSDDADLLGKLADGRYGFAFVSFDLYRKNRQAIMDMDTKTSVVVLAEFGETVPEKNVTALVMPVYVLPVANVLNNVQGDFSYHQNAGFAASFTAPEANVLVVDDVFTNLKVIKGLLLPYGMQVSLCKSGEMALGAIKADRYDMVFMDHLMPEIDGVETTRRIRGLGADDGYFSEVPIVALTANAVSGMREFFLENGFNDFMSKPVDVVKLNAVLEQWIPKEKQLN